MRFDRRWGASALLVAAIAAASMAWRSSPPGASAPRNDRPGGASPSGPGELAPPGTSPTISAGELEQRLREVEAIVAAKNRESERQRSAFEGEGWASVDAAAPDLALSSASPGLLATREPELRAQLLSAPPDREHLDNVAAIAARARDPGTRIAAVEAMARMGQGDPQRALVDTLKKLVPGDPARRALVPLLKPTSMADPFALELAALLDWAGATPDERQQMAMTLALLALREGGPLPGDVAAAMSPESLALVGKMTQLAQRTLQ